MFSYEQIARWLTFPLDPISVEDWVANREIFGLSKSQSDKDRELELACQIEEAKGKQLGELPKGAPLEILLNGYEVLGIFEGDDFVIVVPSGSVKGGKSQAGSAWIYGEKTEEIKLPEGEVSVISVNPRYSTKIKVKLSSGWQIDRKSQVEWVGSGKKKIVFDIRGRPLPEYEVGKEQQENMRKLMEVAI